MGGVVIASGACGASGRAQCLWISFLWRAPTISGADTLLRPFNGPNLQ